MNVAVNPVGKQFRLHINFPVENLASSLERLEGDFYVARKERESIVLKGLHFLHVRCLSNEADPNIPYLIKEADEYYHDPRMRTFLEHILPQVQLMLQTLPDHELWIANNLSLAMINDHDVSADVTVVKVY